MKAVVAEMSSRPNITDIQASPPGDAGMVFYDLYDRHYLRVRKFIVMVVKEAFTADDLTQETFIRAHQKLASLNDPQKALPWLLRIAHNLCLDHFRTVPKNRKSTTIGDASVVDSAAAATVEILERQQMSSCVQQQMTKLPESQRAVLVLYEIFGFAQKEIADILEISIENVKVRLHRARKRFKAILQQNCSFEHDNRNILVCEPKGTAKKLG